MEECFVCGITGDKVILFDAIGEEGILKICGKCASSEDIPIIRKPTEYQIKESERRQNIYQRFSRPTDMNSRNVQKSVSLGKETTLRDIVDRKLGLDSKRREERKPRPDLVDNFHWAIMTARRRKKVSPKQIAEIIGESEKAIVMAEKGILPEYDYRLLNKLESYLGIKLIRRETRELIPAKEIRQEIKPERKLAFDPDSLRTMTIADLREMKKRKEEEMIMEAEDEEIKEYSDEEFGENIDIKEEEPAREDNEKKDRQSQSN